METDLVIVKVDIFRHGYHGKATVELRRVIGEDLPYQVFVQGWMKGSTPTLPLGLYLFSQFLADESFEPLDPKRVEDGQPNTADW